MRHRQRILTLVCLAITVLVTASVHAETDSKIAKAPVLTVDNYGMKVTIYWTQVPNATGYVIGAMAVDDPKKLYTADMGKDTTLPTIDLWDGAAFHFAVVAYDKAGFGPLSNIVTIVISDDVDNDGDGESENEGDCDDEKQSVYSSADENCIDGIDNDCDGHIDNEDDECPADPSCCECVCGSCAEYTVTQNPHGHTCEILCTQLCALMESCGPVSSAEPCE